MHAGEPEGSGTHWLKGIGVLPAQAGLRNTLYCASSTMTPAGMTMPLLSATSLTASRRNELAATG